MRKVYSKSLLKLLIFLLYVCRIIKNIVRLRCPAILNKMKNYKEVKLNPATVNLAILQGKIRTEQRQYQEHQAKLHL